ncbi:F-box protein At2g32560-like [Mangifera indica]|uniref:F-box protein At2g32560-like n=1 Tax=Mangifera indica TaxID=29780 RepID=UPI001CFBD3B2|nr:F-box protein At2g32560-like [Mangifera indica]
MLLYFFITCFSFILFLNSLPLKPLPLWATEFRLLSLWFWKHSSIFSISASIKNTFKFSIIPSVNNMALTSKLDHFAGESCGGMSVLDLPELVLECILEKLPPSGLCSMAGVCSSLRDRCMSDHLWEKHMKQKWGRIIGPAAYRQWQSHTATRKDSTNLKQGKQKLWMKLFSIVQFLSWFRPKVEDSYNQKSSNSLPVDSIMSWYLALESGRFWFPAQVYNRENGHIGFMLSCYDAELSYDPRTDSFQARYPPHGRKVVAIEHGVPWERLRAPPNDTTPHDLHISDCLNELHPGDNIEIQWRRNKEFPYGWWYGVVGHLESCDGNENFCRCHNSDTVVLEFNQYAPGSRWRKTMIDRKDHREEGNEADGFYGGIRKLRSEEEISTWKRLWPEEVLE